MHRPIPSLGLFLLVAALASCSSKPKLVIETEPSDAYLYIKGDADRDLPDQKALLGTTPYSNSTIVYKNYKGKETKVDVKDLLEDRTDFFIIVEKDCYESRSLHAPPLPDRPIKLSRIKDCNLSGTHDDK